MLTETLLSFAEWKDVILKEGATLPEDVTLTQNLYEKYCANFHNPFSPETLNEG